MEVENLAARYNQRSGKFEVAMRVTRDDGTDFMQLHVFYPETLEWRAAEYGIEPTDLDTLIDIVLTDPFDDEDDPLWQVETREEARDLMLAKVQARKERITPAQRRNGKSRADICREAGIPEEYAVAAEEDPIEYLKRAARVNPEVVEMLKEHVDKQREKLKDEQKKEKKQAMAARASVPEAAVPVETPNRVAQLRRRLSPRSENERHDNN